MDLNARVRLVSDLIISCIDLIYSTPDTSRTWSSALLSLIAHIYAAHTDQMIFGWVFAGRIYSKIDLHCDTSLGPDTKFEESGSRHSLNALWRMSQRADVQLWTEVLLVFSALAWFSNLCLRIPEHDKAKCYLNSSRCQTLALPKETWFPPCLLITLKPKFCRNT